MFDVYLDQELAFCSDKAEFICTGYVKKQNKMCWSTDSPRAVLEAPHTVSEGECGAPLVLAT